MIVTGVKKHCILGMLKYHQLQHNLFDDVKYHPETLLMFEELNYKVENNLPVKKEALFKLVPELFLVEINKMGYEAKKKY